MGLFKPNVQRMREKRDIPGLINALSHKDHQVRSEAARLVAVFCDARAVDPLIAALNDGDEEVRYQAVCALVYIADPRALEPLTAALNDRSEHVLKAVVYSLGKIGDSRAVDPLISVYRKASKDIRDSCATVLGKIGAKSKDAALCSRLAEALVSATDHLGYGVCYAIGEIGPGIEDAGLRERMVDFEIAALKDRDADVRESAVQALGKMGAVRALAPVCAALTDEHEHVREFAREALKKLPQPEDVHMLDEHTIAVLAHRRILEVIKEQTYMLLSRTHVVNSRLSLQPGREILMALGQMGFQKDYPNLEGLVWEAVNELVAEGKLVRSGAGVRARR